ncbi:MAG: metallophosphoesterase, partial [Alphaproteobacteria bacterium]|nr:metallophosphoesterase [Alphaproteobacteria bacterium]
MKIIAYSDLHIHPHRFGAGTDDDTGRQSRLQDCLDVLDMTAKAVEDHNAVARLFCGDMFHVRGRIQPSVFNPTLSHFKRVHNPNRFTDYLLVGNHDMEHRANGEHAVHGLRGPGVDILEGYGTMLDDWGRSVLIGWVSYTPDIRELKERVRKVAYDARHEDEHVYRRIFMLHHGVDGAMPSIPDMGFGVLDLPHEDFDLILCGDYHMHRELIPGKAWMIGAPLQHTYGDSGQA